MENSFLSSSALNIQYIKQDVLLGLLLDLYEFSPLVT